MREPLYDRELFLAALTLLGILYGMLELAGRS